MTVKGAEERATHRPWGEKKGPARALRMAVRRRGEKGRREPDSPEQEKPVSPVRRVCVCSWSSKAETQAKCSWHGPLPLVAADTAPSSIPLPLVAPSMPFRANSSARSLPGMPEWPRIQ